MFRSIRDINPSIGKRNTGFRSIRDINPNTVQAPRNTVRNTGFDPSGFSSIGANRNKPPQLTPPRGISAFNDGPNITMKSKPNVPSVNFNFNRGQAGGMRDIPGYAKQPYYTNVESIREKFFDNRPDVSRNRLFRRSEQDRLLENFKNTQMKDVVGATGLKQSIMPGGPTTADEAMRLANIYGPTLSEIGSDLKYGFNQIGKGLAEKGTPLMNLLKSIYGGITNFFTPSGGQGPLE